MSQSLPKLVQSLPKLERRTNVNFDRMISAPTLARTNRPRKMFVPAGENPLKPVVKVHRRSRSLTRDLEEQPISSLLEVKQVCNRCPSPDLRRRVRNSLLRATVHLPKRRPRCNVDAPDATKSLQAINLYFRHAEKKIPTGLAAYTYDDAGVTRHILYRHSVKGQDFAEELDIRDGDELLLIGDVVAIDKSCDVVLKAFLGLKISKRVTLMIRRPHQTTIPAPARIKNAFLYFTISTNIVVEEGIIKARRVDSLKSSKPSLLNFDPNNKTEYSTRISTKFETYLCLKDGQVYCKPLKDEEEWIFTVTEYFDVGHIDYGDVMVRSFKQSQTQVKASDDKSIAVAPANEISRDRDRKQLFMLHKNKFLESVCYQGHLVSLQADKGRICLVQVEIKPNDFDRLNRNDNLKFTIEE